MGTPGEVTVLARASRRFLVRCFCASAVALSTSGAHAYDWLQFGGDAQHSARNTAETTITANNVSSLVQKYQVTLPQTADGAPVFLEAVLTPASSRSTLQRELRSGPTSMDREPVGSTRQEARAIRPPRRQLIPIDSMSTATGSTATSTSIKWATAPK